MAQNVTSLKSNLTDRREVTFKSGRYMCRGHVIVVLPSFTLTGSGSKVVGLLETPIMFLLARRVVFSPL